MVSLAALGSDAALSFSEATVKGKHADRNKVTEYKNIILI